MSGPLKLATALLVGVLVASAHSTGVVATDPSSGADTLFTASILPGFSNPPGTGRNENPCASHPGYTQRISEGTSEVKNTEGSVAAELASTPSSTTYVLAWTGGVGWELPVSDTFNVEWVGWRTACGADDDITVEEPGSEKRFWIRKPTPGNTVPTLVAQLARKLTIPTISWPSADSEYGWLYVNAAMDFRIDPVGPQRLTTTVSNLAGSVTSWAQADPSYLFFDPGEPQGEAVACEYEHAVLPYVVETPGACSYKYRDSSSIARNAVFPSRMTLFWDITSSDPARTDPHGRSWQSANIPVAEIQSIEVLRD